MRRNVIKLIIFLGDFALLFAALAVSLLWRDGFDGFVPYFLQHIPAFSIVFPLWCVVFYIGDLYNFSVQLNHRRYSYLLAVSIALAVGFFYAFPGLELTPKTNLLRIAVVFTVLFYGWRTLVTRTLDQLGIHRPVLLVGSDKQSLEIARKLIADARMGYRIVGIVEDNGSPVPEEILNAHNTKLLRQPDEIRALVERKQVHTVVVSDHNFVALYKILYQLIPLGVYFFRLTTFWEDFDQSIPVFSAHETWFLENINRRVSRASDVVKRGFDIVVTLLLLPAAIPLALFTALAVRISGRGPVIYSQTRLGKNEQPFTIYKFRSMVPDAELNGPQWASTGDPRVTRVGQFIRRSRLDELPQLYNILRGEMSLVGPRPERPEFVRELTKTIPHYRLRHMVKPGLSGWAQVQYRYGSNEEDAGVKLMYDLYYVKNASIILDTKVLLKTAAIVLTQGGL